MEPVLMIGTGQVETIAFERIISLEDAGFADADLAMREIDPNHIEELAESDPDEWPSLECVLVSLGEQVYYVVIDGYHRRETAIEIFELERIPVIAREYKDQNAVIDKAFQANLRHGKASNKQTRSNYAVWLYFCECDQHENEPDYKPNITEIASKAMIDRSTASKAIKKAMKDTDEQGMSEREYREATLTDKLLKAIHGFFDGEHALLTNKTDERDTQKRAKVLYNHLRRLPDNKRNLVLRELIHVNVAIQKAVDVFVEQAKKKTG